VTVTTTEPVGKLRRRLAKKLAAEFSRTGRQATAMLDARLLVAHALGVDPARLALEDSEPVDAAAEACATALIERRIAGEPVARIVGRTEFFGLEFAVGPETLVPRPDSETVVEVALAFAGKDGNRHRPLSILDLGTGSGILLLSLLSHLPHATGVAVDMAPGALSVARENAAALGLTERLHLVLGNWGSALTGGFDIVVANPPYIDTGTIRHLQVEVARHDPYIALDGGQDGLDCFRAILSDLDRLLADHGRGFVEIGLAQADAFETIAQDSGFHATFHRDLGEIERVAELQRKSDAYVVGRPDFGAAKNSLGNQA
jgi:release factor glutamine methyltransferase